MSETNCNDDQQQCFVMCGAALLFQKHDGTQIINKVRSCLIPSYKDDDEFDHKARAERYYNGDKELEGFSLVAWHFAVEAPENT